MTMTTTTGAPWPTRRVREGGRTRTGDVVMRALPAHVPRHAAVEPDVTMRLPVVVPAQRSARPVVVPAGSVPVPAQRSAEPVPVPSAATPVVAPVVSPAVASLLSSAVTRPVASASRRPAPCPPRPAVGSAVHDVAALPRLRTARNGLGVAAACLGTVALPLGLTPVTGFGAAGLGLIALVLGTAGRLRARSGGATNAAVAGAVLGLIAIGLGVVGAVAFLRSPDRLVYDLDALTAPPASVSTIGE